MNPAGNAEKPAPGIPTQAEIDAAAAKLVAKSREAVERIAANAANSANDVAGQQVQGWSVIEAAAVGQSAQAAQQAKAQAAAEQNAWTAAAQRPQKAKQTQQAQQAHQTAQAGLGNAPTSGATRARATAQQAQPGQSGQAAPKVSQSAEPSVTAGHAWAKSQPYQASPGVSANVSSGPNAFKRAALRLGKMFRKG
ncbi:hypothetical protein [Yinghuangia soli]|uniref:Uncharacterized protein n=1 Tax=Yinghuangia soli TaxID=2908204 RepID=A0AA41PXL9_9ACTN|nr:hypothetical protein [Yinghuangia soli]MCF2526719.1 hypothetical protein [Yinghuangia soli]